MTGFGEVGGRARSAHGASKPQTKDPLPGARQGGKCQPETDQPKTGIGT